MQQLEQLERQLGLMIERMVQLKAERDQAKQEARTLREQMDELELQVLQYEEDVAKAAQLHQNELDLFSSERQQIQSRMSVIVDTIKDVLVQDNGTLSNDNPE